MMSKSDSLDNDVFMKRLAYLILNALIRHSSTRVCPECRPPKCVPGACPECVLAPNACRERALKAPRGCGQNARRHVGAPWTRRHVQAASPPTLLPSYDCSSSSSSSFERCGQPSPTWGWGVGTEPFAPNARTRHALAERVSHTITHPTRAREPDATHDSHIHGLARQRAHMPQHWHMRPRLQPHRMHSSPLLPRAATRPAAPCRHRGRRLSRARRRTATNPPHHSWGHAQISRKRCDVGGPVGADKGYLRVTQKLLATRSKNVRRRPWLKSTEGGRMLTKFDRCRTKFGRSRPTNHRAYLNLSVKADINPNCASRFRDQTRWDQTRASTTNNNNKRVL